MRVALGADEASRVVDVVSEQLTELGHEVVRLGRAAGELEAWGQTGRRVGEAVASGACQTGIVCCFTGTGVSIAANKVCGVRAALCIDAETARGARKWNDANVLALSLRLISEEVAREVVRAWLAEPYAGTEDESLSVLSDLDARSRST